jgi:cytochrome c peroxidase
MQPLRFEYKPFRGALALLLAAGTWACGGQGATGGDPATGTAGVGAPQPPFPPGFGGVGTGGDGDVDTSQLPPDPTLPPEAAGVNPEFRVIPGPPPGDVHFDFAAVLARGEFLRPIVNQRQREHLEQRYDLSNRPSGATQTRGKPLQEGVRVRLPAGITWEMLANATPEQVRQFDALPLGFLPLPHVNHDEDGMVFPQSSIDEILRQTGRDLQRFDLDFDIPEHFLAEFPPAIFLTTRKDLGDVSQGRLVTQFNFFEMFKDKLNAKQLVGFQLLLMPLPQQQFNLSDDRRSVEPSQGVACFDCHVNGHTNGAFHNVQDERGHTFRKRVDTVTIRGVATQQLFGSQRALKSVEDFTEFEQIAPYFDGDNVSAEKKGRIFLDRKENINPMAEMQRLFDFPPAPKLNALNELDWSLATEQEIRGEILFNGKARCSECHVPSLNYTDHAMHDLKLERFYNMRVINGMTTKPDGPIKTFPLRGIKDSPPYFHDGRLLTLEDTIEFFNLVLQTRLNEQEKQDLLAFLLTL